MRFVDIFYASDGHRLNSPQTFANTPPFRGCRDATVIHKVLSGVRPDRPEGAEALGLSDHVWETVESCWQAEWDKRPVATVVLKEIETAVSSWVPPVPTLQDKDLEESENNSDSSLCESFSSEAFVAHGPIPQLITRQVKFSSRRIAAGDILGLWRQNQSRQPSMFTQLILLPIFLIGRPDRTLPQCKTYLIFPGRPILLLHTVVEVWKAQLSRTKENCPRTMQSLTPRG